jgi:Xaa-Pro aminopeptidase
MDTRVKHLHLILKEQQLDAILISSPENLYYFGNFTCLSTTEREAYILITKENIYLITSPLYASTKKQKILIKKTSSQKTYGDIIEEIVREEKINILGFEEHYLTVWEFQRLLKRNIKLQKAEISNLRIKKESEEVTAIKKACEIGDKAFKYILNHIKPGIREEHIALQLELFIKKNYATLSFPSIIARGTNAATPHHITGSDRIQNNQFVLLDFGVKVDGYCSDMTRTVFVGKPTHKQKKAYETVRTSQQKAIDYLQKKAQENTTVKAATVDRISRDEMIKNGYPNFPHSLGHGIGIAVHESPSLSPFSQDILREGMVFSIEPGIYISEEIGIRIEDLVYFDKKRITVLTHSPSGLITL